MDTSEGRKRLDDIARAEYGSGFAEAIATTDPTLRMQRIARMAGIDVKSAFAVPSPLQGTSRTGAQQEWHLKPEFTPDKPARAQALARLAGQPGYEFYQRVFQELKGRGAIDPQTDFGSFLDQSHYESNWFFHILESLQPYLCEPKAGTQEPAARSTARQGFWGEVFRVGAMGGVDKGVELSVGAVVEALAELVPFIAFAPDGVTFGLAVFITHYAKRGFCAADFRREVISILRHDLSFETQ
jgi:hypothetical protein